MMRPNQNIHYFQTDEFENAMFQSYLSKLFKKETGWTYDRTAAMGNTGK